MYNMYVQTFAAVFLFQCSKVMLPNLNPLSRKIFLQYWNWKISILHSVSTIKDFFSVINTLEKCRLISDKYQTPIVLRTNFTPIVLYLNYQLCEKNKHTCICGTCRYDNTELNPIKSLCSWYFNCHVIIITCFF